MATKRRNASAESATSEVRSCSTFQKSKYRSSSTTKSKMNRGVQNQLTSNKSTPSSLKKYFVQLVDFESVVDVLKPAQIIDFDTRGHCGGVVQPIVDLESV